MIHLETKVQNINLNNNNRNNQDTNNYNNNLLIEPKYLDSDEMLEELNNYNDELELKIGELNEELKIIKEENKKLIDENFLLKNQIQDKVTKEKEVKNEFKNIKEFKSKKDVKPFKKIKNKSKN